MTKPGPIPVRLTALKTTSTPDLKTQWRDLFETEPPPFNRRYLESRLAYRIQELPMAGGSSKPSNGWRPWASSLTAATLQRAGFGPI